VVESSSAPRPDGGATRKELAFHLEQYAADLMARGIPPGEARRQARLAMGGPEQVKEQCRDERGTHWLEDLWKDVRYALRMFAKNPGTTAVAVLSLAFAIGPNATLFTVVDRMFLRPVTVQGSSQIYFLYPKADRANKSESPSYPDFLDYQARGRGVADFIASSGRGVTVNVNGANQLVFVDLVSENYFQVLGARAAVGRMLLESDARFASKFRSRRAPRSCGCTDRVDGDGSLAPTERPAGPLFRR